MTASECCAESCAQVVRRGGLIVLFLASMGATTPVAAQDPAGAKEFAEVCASCHGPTGRGNVGPRLVPMRKDLEELVAIVREGLGEMPPISTRELNDDQVRNIGRYLRSLSTTPAVPAAAAATPTGSSDKADILATLASAEKAVRDKDVPALQRLYDDGLTYGEVSGKTLTKTQRMASSPGERESTDCREDGVQILGAAAIARCAGRVEQLSGNSEKHEINVLWVLVKQPAGWRILARQATLVR